MKTCNVQVSILTRPSGRMQRCTPLAHMRLDAWSSFNPHPAFWPDATTCCPKAFPQAGFRIVSILTRPSGRMQPHYQASTTIAPIPIVSILTRPSGRMQPRLVIMSTSLEPYMFQSSPGLLAGCNASPGRTSGRRHRPLFQSSPGLLAGCNDMGRNTILILHCRFNPHPAFWPDATGAAAFAGHEDVDIHVSILTRPSGRMQHARTGWYAMALGVVSILTRPSGRMQPAALDEDDFALELDVSILTRPSGRMQPSPYSAI